METLPPRIADEVHFGFLTDTLDIDVRRDGPGPLRLRSFEPGFSWQALADMAEGHGVLFPLIWSLRRRALLPPPRLASTDALAQAYATHLDLRSRQSAQLARAVAVLNASGIEPLLLKGARYLATESDGWQQARPMRDIDLLVREPDAERAVAALRAAGYRDEGGLAVKGKHLPELFHPDHPCAIEIHVEALAHPFHAVLPAAKLWALAQQGSLSGAACRILPDSWQALHCALTHQLTDHGHERCVLALRPLWEFAWLMAGAGAGDWQPLQVHLGAARFADAFASFAEQSHALCGLTLPPALASEAAAGNARTTLARLRSPEPLRRAQFLLDQARFALSRDTLAYRYGLLPGAVTPSTRLRHVAFLLGRYRGKLLERLLGAGRSS